MHSQLKRQYQNKSFHDLAALADYQASNDPNAIWKRLKALPDHKPNNVFIRNNPPRWHSI